MSEPLSKIERRILDYLIEYLKKNTYQPSIREIGKRFGIKSTKTVSEYLQSLAEKGYIEREASRSRGVKILGLDLERPDVISVPFYGRIAPGQPTPPREDADPRSTPGAGPGPLPPRFFLEIRSEGLEEIGIVPGDLALIEAVEEGALRSGEIVAARIAGEAAIKRYIRRGEQIVLEPANRESAPVLMREQDDFAILGRVAGLFRHFSAPQIEAIGG